MSPCSSLPPSSAPPCWPPARRPRPQRFQKPEDRSGPTTGRPPSTTPDQARQRKKGWNDRRRTVRSYFGNLGYNAIRPLARPNWPAFAIGGGLAGGATAVDTETVDYFGRHHMTTLGNVGASAGGSIAVGALAVGLFSAGRIFPGDRFRSASYDASQGLLLTTAYTFAFKYATQRQRPDDSNRQSFPSGHASLAFTWATIAERHYGAKGGIPAYTAASLIAISRCARQKHYLSDVVAGATLGHLIGRTVVRCNSRPAAGVPAKPVVPPTTMLVPMIGPHSAGLELAASF